MKTVLICHAGDKLNEIGLARWLHSFSDLVGVVVIQETRRRLWKRVRREVKRVGVRRFADVLAFRLYYRAVLARRDRIWEERLLNRLTETYREHRAPILYTSSPNSDEAREFIASLSPDIMIARCKTLLKESVYSIPNRGTFAMHPGVCPEYRNAHGCFWALASGEPHRVGMTLLRIDTGVDTGAVYGYFSCEFDQSTDSHVVIQHRVVFDNLLALQEKLEDIHRGGAKAIDITGRKSATWGQPWLSRYLRLRRQARRSSPRATEASHV